MAVHRIENTSHLLATKNDSFSFVYTECARPYDLRGPYGICCCVLKNTINFSFHLIYFRGLKTLLKHVLLATQPLQ